MAIINESDICRYVLYVNELGQLGGHLPICRLPCNIRKPCPNPDETKCQIAGEAIISNTPVPTIVETAGFHR